MGTSVKSLSAKSKAGTSKASIAKPASSKTNSSTGNGDAQVLANQETAANLGISIPGVNGTYTQPKTINSQNTAPTTPITLPPKSPPSNLGTTAITIAGADAVTGANAIDAAKEQEKLKKTEADTSFEAYLKSIKKPASTEDIYTKTEKDTGVQQKQSLVNTLTNQLNAIVTKSQADKLSLVGQGRGVTEAIIGGQQAQIDREAAIQSLPVSAQLAAAQGDLTSAQDRLNTLFKIRSEDATNKYNYGVKLAETVWNYATSKQKTALEEKRIKDANEFSLVKDTINFAESLALKAIENGQPSLAGRLMALDHNSPTYKSDVANLSKGIVVAQKVSGSGGGTLEERQADAVAALNSLIASGKPLKGGVPVLDANNKITPVAWNTLIESAPAQGLSRASFITTQGNRIYTEVAKDGSITIPASYNLTPAEKKLILGS